MRYLSFVILNIETKKYKIASALRTASTGDNGHTEYMRKAMEAAITVLER